MKKFLAVAALALMACYSEPTSPPPVPIDTPIGGYTLISVNGLGLPVTLYNSSVQGWVITGGSLTVGVDNSYTSALNWTTPGFLSIESGTWKSTTTSIEFTSSFTSQPVTSPREGGTITKYEFGAALTFLRN